MTIAKVILTVCEMVRLLLYRKGRRAGVGLDGVGRRGRERAGDTGLADWAFAWRSGCDT